MKLAKVFGLSTPLGCLFDYDTPDVSNVFPSANHWHPASQSCWQLRNIKTVVTCYR